MKKINIDFSTMNRVSEVVRPFVVAGNCLSLEFGTGVCDGGGKVPNALISKVSVTNGCEQAELALFTEVPADVPKGISAVNPAIRVIVRADEFVSVVDALSAYEQQYEIEINESNIMISVGSAQVPVSRVSEGEMKALVPHKMNSAAVEMFDKDILNLRIQGKELMMAVKAAGAFTKRITDPGFGYFNVAVKDIAPVMVNVEVDGQSKTVCRYNCQVQFVSTDKVSFASGSCRALSIKGMPEEQVKQMQAQRLEGMKKQAEAEGRVFDVTQVPDIFKGVENPVVSFTKEEDNSINPVVQAYKNIKAEFDTRRELTLPEDEFQFGIPVASLEKLVKLASLVPDAYVELTVGEKYIYAFVQSVQAIFLCPQKALHKTSFATMYRGAIAAVAQKACAVSFDAKAASNALRLCNLYEKDALIGQMPIELTVGEKDVEVKRGEAKSVVPTTAASTKIDTVVYGVNGAYLASTLGALPAGNVQISYGLDKPMLVFNAGGEAISPYGTGMLVLGVADVEQSKKQIRDSYEKSLEEKRKKDEKKKDTVSTSVSE